MRYRYWSSGVIVTIATLLLAACGQSGLEGDPKPEPNDELSSRVELMLENGNRLEFHNAIDEGSEFQGVLVVESGEEGSRSALPALSTMEELANSEVTAADIFWALSEPSTPVPAFLTTLHEKSAGSLAQGWARHRSINVDPVSENVSLETTAQDLACNNSTFTSSIAGGFLSNNPFTSLDRTPGNSSVFTSDCLSPFADGKCWGKPRYQYMATFTNTKKWRGKICGKAVQPTNAGYLADHVIRWTNNTTCKTGCSAYFGPEFFFRYYWNGYWRTMKSNGKVASYTIAANKTRWATWHWETSQPTSFRLHVRQAKHYDEFDFMMDR